MLVHHMFSKSFYIKEHSVTVFNVTIKHTVVIEHAVKVRKCVKFVRVKLVIIFAQLFQQEQLVAVKYAASSLVAKDNFSFLVRTFYRTKHPLLYPNVFKINEVSTLPTSKRVGTKNPSLHPPFAFLNALLLNFPFFDSKGLIGDISKNNGSFIHNAKATLRNQSSLPFVLVMILVLPHFALAQITHLHLPFWHERSFVYIDRACLLFLIHIKHVLPILA